MASRKSDDDRIGAVATTEAYFAWERAGRPRLSESEQNAMYFEALNLARLRDVTKTAEELGAYLFQISDDNPHVPGFELGRQHAQELLRLMDHPAPPPAHVNALLNRLADRSRPGCGCVAWLDLESCARLSATLTGLALCQDPTTNP